MKSTKKLTINDIINRSNIIHNNKYDYSLIEYKNARTPVKIRCLIHDYIFNVTIDNHINKNIGCPKCSNKYHYNKDELLLLFNKKHDNKYTYNLDNYINNKSIIKIKCPIHNEFKLRIQHHINGVGCKKCNDSKGEKQINIILKKYNITYETQKIFNNCIYKKNLKFDFYLPDYNTCIEYDGEQHFKKFRFENDNTNLNERILKDEIKNKYCIDNNIKLLRISYFYYSNIEYIICDFLKLNFN